jgi:hypothetical protein
MLSIKDWTRQAGDVPERQLPQAGVLERREEIVIAERRFARHAQSVLGRPECVRLYGWRIYHVP